MNSLECIFWLGVGIVLYSYFGYGILLYFMVKIKKLFQKEASFDPTFEPKVSLVVPCFNEAEYIEDKIINSLALDYPKDKLQLIFISDGSNDDTPDRIKKYPQVLALHENARNGKAAAMNRAMAYVNSSIVVFCDANTDLNPEAIKEMVKHYADPKVGAVTGEKRIITKDLENASGAGEGIYWKYESFLKQLDSDFYTIVGAAGELMSYRTELYKELPKDSLLDDLMQSMQIANDGYRVIYEKNAWAAETASANVGEELKRKVRIAAGAFQSMGRLPKAFNLITNFRVSFLFISHRVLRWTLAPLSLLVLLIVNSILACNVGGIYLLFLIGQLLFYGMALLGWYLANKQIKVKVLFVPYYFFIMNLCMYLGLIRFIRGKQSANWERAKRA
ncbi:MAG: glycosyltransferase family 2 protein [Bacteroidia bacterium]|nr:glycosyltransferase family 2 protein [Bacteroidia bacterium]MCF8425936.1 glycosyltransferase family 2 protein [Bacteroidia bacterium]MCF8446301.1 glycosyltransferase family 2 protein [Bacteroidia bacterium]